MLSADAMNKSELITAISNAGDRYGDLLIMLMDTNNALSLQEITREQAQKFYERMVLMGGQYKN